MNGIAEAILATARNPATVKLGIVESYGGALAVNVDGTHPPVRWPANYSARVGDAVMVYITDGAAWVLSSTSTTTRPEEGKTTGTAVDGLIPVTGSDGVAYRCRYVGTAPTVGAAVLMLWQSSQPWILSGVAAPSTSATPPPVTPTPPPSAPTTGTLSIAAADAASYSSDNGWASEGPRQGSVDGRKFSGAWWYGNGPGHLRGATVRSISIRIQRALGGDGTACAPQAYAVTSQALRGNGPTFTLGPVPLPPLGVAVSGWASLPASWGQGLVDGSITGIGLRDGNYMRCTSLLDDAASGQIKVEWERG